MTSATSDQTHNATLFAKVDSYPWDSDAEFQGGLLAILGSEPAPQQANELALRARCFYYERKFNVSINFNAYKEWRDKSGIGAPSGPTYRGTDDVPDDEQVRGEAVPGIAPFSLGASVNAGEGGNIDGSPGDSAAPYPTSFAHIVELITSGKPIPGIKDVPETVLSGQETQSKCERRRKPWER